MATFTAGATGVNFDDLQVGDLLLGTVVTATPTSFVLLDGPWREEFTGQFTYSNNEITISGGAGADVFSIFGEAGLERILDFNVGEGDRLRIEAGYTYSTAQVGADVVVTLSGGAQAVLANVNLSSLGSSWIFTG